MTAFGLYLHARRVGLHLVGAAGFGLIAFLLGRQSLSVPSLRSTDHIRLPVGTLIPLLVAVLLAYSFTAPNAEVELSWSFPQRRFRAALVLLTVTAGVAVVSTLLLTPSAYVYWQALRNFAGDFGLALAALSLFGVGASWAVPIIFTIAATLLARGPDGGLEPWAWPVQPPENAPANVIALGLFLLGSSIMTISGPHNEAEGDS